jgi:hypothetical protein
VGLLDLVTLYVNLNLAAQHPEVGYHNVDMPLKVLNNRLQRHSVYIKHNELEGLLYACQQLDENGQFWNVNPDQPFKTFVNKILNYKQTRLYFHQVYNWIYKKTGKGRPKKNKKEIKK